MKALLYGNGEVDNLGCEAISRSTTYILHKVKPEFTVDLTTQMPEKYSDYLESFADHAIAIKRGRGDLLNIISEVLSRSGMRTLSMAIPNIDVRRQSVGYDYTFSIGGDNYCYSLQEKYYRMNMAIRKNSSVNVFWACSIEPGVIDSKMIKDLLGYDYIFARESITADSLKDKGLKNVYLCADPAFELQPEKVIDLSIDNCIGVNLSPLVFKYSQNAEKTKSSVLCCLKEILDKTDYNICFIPHVFGQNGDHKIALEMTKCLPHKDRIIVLDEGYNCAQTKYIISRMKALICARTHASIAGYSSCIPTFVLGYSVKAKGIAKDIYGEIPSHVMPVQEIDSEDSLTKRIMPFITNIEDERAYLKTVMPIYKERAYAISKVFE